MASGSGGPSVLVRVLADLKGFTDNVTGAGDHVQSTAGRMSTAFKGVTSGLNSTGVLAPFQGAIDGISTALDHVSEHGKSVGTTLMGVGAGVAGIGAALSLVGSKDQAAHQQLQAAVAATGKSYDDYASRVDEAIKHQEGFGTTADKTSDALRILTQATHDPAKALDLLNQTADLAAAKHIDLSTAATSVGRVFNGNTKVLKEYGVQADKAVDTTKQVEAATKTAATADAAHATAVQRLADIHAEYAGKASLTVAEQIRLRDATNKVADSADVATRAHDKLNGITKTVTTSTQAGASNLQKLADVTKGQASAAADSFGGKLKALKANVEDAVASFGQKYGPAIQVVGVAMTALGGIMTAFPAIQAAVAAGWSFIAGGEMLALWPVALIALAVVALGVLIYELVTHWSDVWGAIKKVVMDVWDWISNNWPLLLAIITGPFGLAVLFIVDHWSQILAFFQTIWDGIKAGFSIAINFVIGLWNGLVNIVVGIASTIGSVMSGAWNAVWGAAAWVIGLIKGGWNDVVGFVTGLPGRIGSAVGGMWDGIWNTFRGAINKVIGAWNDLHFTVGGGSFLGVDIPSFTLDTPNLPTLALGGIVTAPTLALIGERGPEAVVPLDRAGALGGPALVINDAHFATEVDVEVLMRQVAWMTRTRAI